MNLALCYAVLEKGGRHVQPVSLHQDSCTDMHSHCLWCSHWTCLLGHLRLLLLIVLKVELAGERRGMVSRHSVVLWAQTADTHGIKDDSDDETAARTFGYILCLLELPSGDFKPVAAGAGVVEQVALFIVRHVLQLNLIVVGESGHAGWPN